MPGTLGGPGLCIHDRALNAASLCTNRAQEANSLSEVSCANDNPPLHCLNCYCGVSLQRDWVSLCDWLVSPDTVLGVGTMAGSPSFPTSRPHRGHFSLQPYRWPHPASSCRPTLSLAVASGNPGFPSVSFLFFVFIVLQSWRWGVE